MKKIILFFLIVLAIFVFIFTRKPADLAPGLKTFGVTFSKIAADSLKLSWQQTYLAILDDLKVKNIRLSVYWSEVERVPGKLDFRDVDWQLKEAEKRNAKVILTIGRKVPRWPECHIPDWAKSLSEKKQQEKVLALIGKIVDRYKDNPAIEYWQVENEPFLPFGICPELDKDFLGKEISLVKEKDKRPIIVTDSGELGSWLPAARRADIFGTTMYQTIWSEKIPGSGYFSYPLVPQFFYLKASLIKYFADAKDIIISELQAEPWGPKQIYELTVEEAQKSMNLDKFQRIVEFAKKVGFREAYLWGAEWWYKEKLEGRTEIWDEAKKLFQQ